MMVQNATTSSTNRCQGQRRILRNRSSTRRRVEGTLSHRMQPSLESIPEDFCKEYFTDDQALHDNSLTLVNQERARRNLPPFRPSPELQQLAERQCHRMAQEGIVSHSVQSIEQLVALLKAPHAAESIQRGSSLLEMHHETLSQRRSINYCNLVSTVFTEFGAATCRGEDGKLYQCQLFRK